jgi:predicted enzyme related to lactoylglutathione lyase
VVTLGNITMYANDPRSLAHFWADVFGYPKLEWEDPLRQQLLDSGLTEADLASRALAEDPEGKGPRFFFHHADSVKQGRNRIHLDVNVGRDPDAAPSDHSRIDAEKDRLVALGATVVRRIEQTWGPWPEYYYQMQDPEGNEFCLQ